MLVVQLMMGIRKRKQDVHVASKSRILKQGGGAVSPPVRGLAAAGESCHWPLCFTSTGMPMNIGGIQLIMPASF